VIQAGAAAELTKMINVWESPASASEYAMVWVCEENTATEGLEQLAMTGAVF